MSTFLLVWRIIGNTPIILGTTHRLEFFQKQRFGNWMFPSVRESRPVRVQFFDARILSQYIKCKSVPHRKHYVTTTKPNRLMLFRETVAVYCENHTEHINTLCGQNTEFSAYLTVNTPSPLQSPTG
jgi:hypothetical protein